MIKEMGCYLEYIFYILESYMGKIYIDIKTKELKYLDNADVCENHILFSSLHRKIVLVSINNIRYFPSIDVNKVNKELIQRLLKNGYNVLLDSMRLLITQNYNICPCCGEDIDISVNSETVVYDIGTSLSNLSDNNIYPYKELICSCCGEIGDYYCDIYSSSSERLAFARNSALSGSAVYIKFMYPVYGDAVFVPIIIDFNQLLAFFDKPVPGTKSDIMTSFSKMQCGTLVNLLFNDEIKKIISTSKNNIEENLLIDVRPCVLNYSKFNTQKDNSLLLSLMNIGNDKNRLLELISLRKISIHE